MSPSTLIFSVRTPPHQHQASTPTPTLDPSNPFKVSTTRMCKMWRVTLSLIFLLYQSNHARTAPHPAEVLPPSHSVPLQSDVPYTDSNPNKALWTPASPQGRPQPNRSGKGAPLLGPENIPLELQNADLLAPPTTDNGQVKNFKWPFSFSHQKLKDGGWSRQQTGALCNLMVSSSMNRSLLI